MTNHEVINMEKIDLIARKERAQFIADLASRFTQKLGTVFVSKMRVTGAKTSARLQAA